MAQNVNTQGYTTQKEECSLKLNESNESSQVSINVFPLILKVPCEFPFH